MDFLILIILILNLILSIGIAGAVVRSKSPKKSVVPKMSRQQRFIDVESRTPNYAEVGMLNPVVSPEIKDAAQPNWDGVSRLKKNWDGLPELEE